jgi:predicted permease
MLDIFSQAFTSTFSALAVVFLVVGAAGSMVRARLITQDQINGLATATVSVFLPCLIFSNVLTNFEPGAMPVWWVIPLIGILMPMVGIILGVLVFVREMPAKRNLLPVASMQNAGYLVLPVGVALYPAEFDTFALYCFLFILGYNPVLWSVGKLLATDDGRAKLSWRGLLSPPLWANVGAVVAVLLGLDRFVPKVVVDAVELLGRGTVPVATFVLGAVLGSISLRIRPYLFDAFRVLLIKMAILPLLTVVLLMLSGVNESYPLLAQFFVIESAAAPAAGLILQVRSYGGDETKIGSLMFLSYLACALAMPVWLALWHVLQSS